MNTFCVLCRKNYLNPHLLFPFPPPGPYRDNWAVRITDPPESEWTEDFRICALHFPAFAFKKIGIDGKSRLKQNASPMYALTPPANAKPIPARHGSSSQRNSSLGKSSENPSEVKPVLAKSPHIVQIGHSVKDLLSGKTYVGRKIPPHKNIPAVDDLTPKPTAEDEEDSFLHGLLNESTAIEVIKSDKKESTAIEEIKNDKKESTAIEEINSETKSTKAATSDVVEPAEEISIDEAVDDISIDNVDQVEGTSSSEATEKVKVSGPAEGVKNSGDNEENKISGPAEGVKNSAEEKKIPGPAETIPGAIVIAREKACSVCTNPSRVLFPFPKHNPRLFKAWTAVTKIPPSQWDSPLRICSDHFFKSSIEKKDGKLKLLANAVPALRKVDQRQEDRWKPPEDEDTLSGFEDDSTKNLSPSKLSNKKIVFNTLDRKKLTVPPGRNESAVHCAICMSKVARSKAVPLRNVSDEYTRFGFALATLIKSSYLTLQSRFCCVKCSEVVTVCYDTFVDINVTAQISSRRWGEILAREGDLTIKGADFCKDAFNEKCVDCGLQCSDFATYGDHYREHAFQRLLLPRPSVSVQADEFDLYTECREAEMQSKEAAMPEPEPEPPVQRRRRREKSKNKDNIVVVEETNGTETVAVTDVSTGQTVLMKQKQKKDNMDWKKKQGHSEAFEETICHICGKVCTSESQYKTHMYNHTHRRRTAECCHLCGKQVVDIRTHLENHKKWDQKKKDNPEKPQAAGSEEKADATKAGRKKWRKPKPCNECGKWLSPAAMLLHKRRFHGAPLEKCHFCGQEVITWFMHMKKYHKEEYERHKNTFEGITQKCDLCDATFLQRTMLRIHMTIKHGFDPRQIKKAYVSPHDEWTCYVCGDKFRRFNELSTHTKEKHNGKGTRVSCEGCGKTYGQVTTLIWHVSINHVANYYNFKCKKCGHLFVSEEKFNVHICPKSTRLRLNKRLKNDKPTIKIPRDDIRPPKRRREKTSEKFSAETLRYAESLGPPVPKKMKKEKKMNYYIDYDSPAMQSYAAKEENDYEYDVTYYSQYERERDSTHYSHGKVGIGKRM